MLFGKGQINRPTPASLERALKITTVVLQSLNIWIGSASWIPVKNTVVIVSLLSLLNIICVAVTPFFGVRIDSSTVPTDQVKSIEEK